MADKPSEERTESETVPEQTPQGTEPENQETPVETKSQEPAAEESAEGAVDKKPEEEQKEEVKEEVIKEVEAAANENKEDEKEATSAANGATANDTHKVEAAAAASPGGAIEVEVGGEADLLITKGATPQPNQHETVKIHVIEDDSDDVSAAAYCWSHKVHIFLFLVIILNFAGVIATIVLRPSLIAGIGTLAVYVLLFAILGLMWAWTRKARAYAMKPKVYVEVEA